MYKEELKRFILPLVISFLIIFTICLYIFSNMEFFLSLDSSKINSLFSKSFKILIGLNFCETGSIKSIISFLFYIISLVAFSFSFLIGISLFKNKNNCFNTILISKNKNIIKYLSGFTMLSILTIANTILLLFINIPYSGEFILVSLLYPTLTIYLVSILFYSLGAILSKYTKLNLLTSIILLLLIYIIYFVAYLCDISYVQYLFNMNYIFTYNTIKFIIYPIILLLIDTSLLFILKKGR